MKNQKEKIKDIVLLAIELGSTTVELKCHGWITEQDTLDWLRENKINFVESSPWEFGEPTTINLSYNL